MDAETLSGMELSLRCLQVQSRIRHCQGPVQHYPARSDSRQKGQQHRQDRHGRQKGVLPGDRERRTHQTSQRDDHRFESFFDWIRYSIVSKPFIQQNNPFSRY